MSKTRFVSGSLLAYVLLGLLAPAGAKWARPQDVPIERLLKTTRDYIRAHPKDPEGYYTLGRINSAAYAQGTETLGMYAEDKLPQFPGYDASPIQPRHPPEAPGEHALAYFAEAIRNYRTAVRLDPKNALAQLGLGFQCEEGLRFPATVEAAWKALNLSGKPGSDKLRATALEAYRKAYALTLSADIAQGHGGLRTPVSQEAGEGIVRLQKDRKLTAAEQAEVERVQKTIETLKSRPRAITPILVSFDKQARLADLLEPGSRVAFDLDGMGGSRAWPWVRRTTGILVWDPKRTGKIESGLQLFGSVTWWMFWKDGYAPLAALDTDHSGWLEAAELRGIAVWFDRNGNGVSEPGEVVSLAKAGIRRIAVRAQGKQDGTPWNAAGIERTDGTTAATFDWTPASLP